MKGHLGRMRRKLREDEPNEVTAAGSDNDTATPGKWKVSAVKGKAATMATTKAASRIVKKSKNGMFLYPAPHRKACITDRHSGSKVLAKAKTSPAKDSSKGEASPEMDDFVFSIEKEGSEGDQVAGGDEEDEF